YCDPYELNNVTGIIVPVDCPPGYYCPTRTEFAYQNPCAPGTFSNTTQLTSQDDCFNCLGEYFCETPGSTSPTGPCLAGFFCTSRANESSPTDSVTGNICPQGKYCPEGSSEGVDCPIGYYGNRTGLTAAVDCTPCDPGYYCPMPGLTAPFGQCEPGHYCKQGANYSTPTDETWGYWCPIGHYCPRGIPTPVPCDMGTYQPDVEVCTNIISHCRGDIYLTCPGKQSSSDCVPCEPGYYCLTTGQHNVTAQCMEGYYCSQGNYCPLGSDAPIPCPNATFMNHTGGSECYVCPEGYYCVNQDRADICPQGFYCLVGTGYGFVPCPIGSY
ncbi:hypothetical protein LSAT2_013520, partial [Lamellibrachia satsuma]